MRMDAANAHMHALPYAPPSLPAGEFLAPGLPTLISIISAALRDTARDVVSAALQVWGVGGEGGHVREY
jgi:hypothetical protein